MPTLRGVIVGVTGLALMALGRAFGATGLLEVGSGLLVLVLTAVVVVRYGRHDLEVTRAVSPRRANAEQKVEVSLTVRNSGAGRAPVLLLEDSLPSSLTGRGRFTLMGLEPAGRRDIGYELRAPRRGRYLIGPLRITSSDPFRLARVSERRTEVAELLVHPRTEPLKVPRDIGQYRSPAVASIRQLTGARGDDFYTLREYVNGDDLRKIHWASTAKRDRYMIRQEETPWHTRATILLDDLAAHHRGSGPASTFERSIEACASLAALYSRSGYSFRLECVAGRSLPAARGGQHYAACLDLLATLTASPGPQDAFLRKVSGLQLGGAAEGTLVAVASALDFETAAALGQCRRRYRDVFAVLFPGEPLPGSGPSQEVGAVITTLARSGVRPLIISPGESLGRAWSAVSYGHPRTTEVGWAQSQEHA